MTIHETLAMGEKRLSSLAMGNARLEALWLLSSLYKELKNPQDLYLEGKKEVPSRLKLTYEKAILRRLKGEPLAYILGYQEFFGLKFKVTPSVLVPRQETEILVEEAIRIAKGFPSPVILDLGTGAGNIAVSIAKFCPFAKVVASDISKEAVKVAQKNAVFHQVKNIVFLQGDLFSPLTTNHLPLTNFDFIVSNPPYVKTHELKQLQREIQKEPALALDGGEDGMKFIQRIIFQAREHLQKNGFLILEIGYHQSEVTKNLMLKAGFCDVYTVKDISGIERVIVGKNG